jgi:S-formylglutathione hydrolase FrmB
MGGHGALTIALKNAHKYKCVSAIAPICNPTMCPWGIKAFGGYLGVDNKDAWKRYDACELAKQYVDDRQFDILIDQGEEDEFLKTEQLLPEHFVAACSSRLNVQLRMQPVCSVFIQNVTHCKINLFYFIGLRSQLLLHFDIHRRPHCSSFQIFALVS